MGSSLGRAWNVAVRQEVLRVVFLENPGLIRDNFRDFLLRREPAGAIGVSYRGTRQKDKMQASIRFPARFIPETFR